MVCRHGPNDPNCSSSPEGRRRAEEESWRRVNQDKDSRIKQLQEEIKTMTPDASQYEIIDVRRVGDHLVMKVQYPSCSKCSFEGTKIMVFLDVTEMQALRWRKIDPHFRDGEGPADEAPGPDARFPASERGWRDALLFAELCMSSKKGRQ